MSTGLEDDRQVRQIGAANWARSGNEHGMSRTYTSADEARLQHARQEYHALAERDAAKYKLSAAFDHASFSIVDHCRDFTPNPVAADAEKIVQEWAQHFGLWIPGVSEHCNNLGSYLYPGANLIRLVSVAKCFIVDWYLNDTIGRDRFGPMSPGDRDAADRMRNRIIQVSRTLAGSPDASPVEQACLAMLGEIKSLSSPDWFANFLQLWVVHLHMMCRDGNARACGVVWTTEQYIQARLETSGMYWTTSFCEFVEDRYLDWNHLDCQGLATDAGQCHWLVSAIGCISNDLFSFEKEFVRDGSDSNLVLVLLLNNEDMTLHDAFTTALTMVREYMIEFMDLLHSLGARCDQLPGNTPGLEALRIFIRSTRSFVMAFWTWQNFSKRYKSVGSIFRENRPREEQL